MVFLEGNFLCLCDPHETQEETVLLDNAMPTFV